MIPQKNSIHPYLCILINHSEFQNNCLIHPLFRDHEGGFTSFECDLTDAVIPGKTAVLTVMCKHRHDALMDWPSAPEYGAVPGYAGIIDEVTLFALPRCHLSRFIFETILDDAYANAVLNILTERTGEKKRCRLKIQLTDPQDKDVRMDFFEMPVPKTEYLLEIPVSLPQKWDAEHPKLYTLKAELLDDQQNLLAAYERKVGFRNVMRKGNNLYVNGVKTKLRGAALYGHDPILGKVFDREKLERIVQAAKWANINYFRSSA